MLEVFLSIYCFCVIRKKPKASLPFIYKWETSIKNKSISAPTPVIPAEIMPDGKLENYYILWEVEEWKPVPPKDPILLKRISPNLFAVIATWNLTKIEQAVMKGHIR